VRTSSGSGTGHKRCQHGNEDKHLVVGACLTAAAIVFFPIGLVCVPFAVREFRKAGV
jgi:hypothetical protein